MPVISIRSGAEDSGPHLQSGRPYCGVKRYQVGFGSPQEGRSGFVPIMQSVDFEGELTRIVEEPGENHVSVDRLLDGIRQYALQEYGPMAMMVLNSWGVKSCADFGEVVFK